jgi:hypothetical protein
VLQTQIRGHAQKLGQRAQQQVIGAVAKAQVTADQLGLGLAIAVSAVDEDALAGIAGLLDQIVQMLGRRLRRIAQYVRGTVGNQDHVARIELHRRAAVEAHMTGAARHQVKARGVAIRRHAHPPWRRRAGTKVQRAAQLDRVEYVTQNVHLLKRPMWRDCACWTAAPGTASAGIAAGRSTADAGRSAKSYRGIGYNPRLPPIPRAATYQ